VQYAQAVGLIACFTPVRSPESNDMVESFVKSFKQDYVFFHMRRDALTVLEQLAAWLADYTQGRPHRGLRMCSLSVPNFLPPRVRFKWGSSKVQVWTR
jgi:transposase InsO family protein